jgi:hypothetical protein
LCIVGFPDFPTARHPVLFADLPASNTRVGPVDMAAHDAALE